MTRTERVKIHDKIAKYITDHASMTFSEIGLELGISLPTVSRIAIKHGLGRREGAAQYEVTQELVKKLGLDAK